MHAQNFEPNRVAGSGTNRLIRLREVIAKTGLCRSAVYAEQAAGNFPPSVKIGQRSVAWSERAVDNWIADRLKAG